MLMTRTTRHSFVPTAAILALVIALTLAVPAAAADFTISDFTPVDGATVPVGQDVMVSAFIVTDGEIALVNGKPDVQVAIDGSPVDAQFVVGSKAERVGFRVNWSFVPGQHSVNVTARSISGATKTATWTFTAAGSPPPAPAVDKLPGAGGIPADWIAVFGLTLTLVGLRLRAGGRT